MNILTTPCGNAKNRKDFIMTEPTESWAILKAYEKDGRIFLVVWECNRTTDGVTLPFGGESYIDAPSDALQSDLVSLVMLEIGPSQLAEMRRINSEIAAREAVKQAAKIITF